MSTDRRQLRVGFSIWPYGRHLSSWRLPEVPIDGEFNASFYRRSVETCERGLFDYYFIGSALASAVEPAARVGDNAGVSTAREATRRGISDRLFKPDALTTAAWLAGYSEHIGLVPTINSSYADPYDTARQTATLDHFTGGRVGINVVAGRSDEAAHNYGLDKHLSNEERFDRADEWTEVLRGLWDSWEPDWFVGDKEAGVFFDPSKAHALDHEGRFFRVAGPMNVPASPQRHVPLVHAGTSERSFEYGARYADIRFIPFDGDQKAYYADQKARAAAFGRDPEQYFLMPGITFYAAESDAEAHALFRRVHEASLKPYDAVALGKTLGAELDGIDGSTKVTDAVDVAALGERAQVVERAFHGYGDDGITLAELDRFVGNGPMLQPPVVGSGASIADWLEQQLEERTLDGVVVMPPFLPDALDSFVDLVVPELQRRGVYRTSYETHTLREHFGLPLPENRHAA